MRDVPQPEVEAALVVVLEPRPFLGGRLVVVVAEAGHGAEGHVVLGDPELVVQAAGVEEAADRADGAGHRERDGHEPAWRL